MANLEKIEVAPLIVFGEKEPSFWERARVEKEVLASYFQSEQYQFFLDGVKVNEFKNGKDFMTKLYNKFCSPNDMEMNAHIYDLTYGDSIYVVESDDGSLIVDCGRHRVCVARELGLKYIYGIKSK